MKPDLIIAHGPACLDGRIAAWVLWSKWPEVPIVYAQYGDEAPDVTGKHVLIVDFSYPKSVLAAMAAEAKSITVLDHHKTAQDDLAEFKTLQIRSPESVQFHADSGRGPRIQALFDMTKSGAKLAWEYVWPGRTAPMIVQFVEDRDLWLFHLDGTKEINAFLMSFDYDMAAFNRFARQIEGAGERAHIIAEGSAILRDRYRLMQQMLDSTTRTMVIGGHRVPVANMPYAMASDAAGQLAEGNPFAATYFDRSDGLRAFSLRSREGGLDVSEIAELYKGGGHKGAAGILMPAGWEGDPEPAAPGVTILDEEIVE